jgi:hypothetical protein
MEQTLEQKHTFRNIVPRLHVTPHATATMFWAVPLLCLP